MCIQESLGYTCGHSSLAILRPCPLTTQDHRHPVCTLIGDRSIPAGTMCPGCQRVMNTRATMIEECEHRFLHERGVCGCRVQFPHLIRPRLIGPVNQDFRPGTAHEHTTHVPPSFAHGFFHGVTALSVRQPSLFAAEWVDDHRALHRTGQCACPGDFRTYQEYMAAQPHENPDDFSLSGLTITVPAAQHANMVPEHVLATPVYRADLPVRPHSAFKLGRSGDATGSDRADTPIPSGPLDAVTPSAADEAAVATEGTPARDHAETSASCAEEHHPVQDNAQPLTKENEDVETKGNNEAAAQNVIGIEAKEGTATEATAAAATMGQDDDLDSGGSGSVNWQMDGPSDVDHSYHAGAVFGRVPGHLTRTGYFLTGGSPYAANPAPTGVAGDTKFLCKPEKTPLVGLPIGAGPEQISHAGPWETCTLHPAARQPSASRP